MVQAGGARLAAGTGEGLEPGEAGGCARMANGWVRPC